MSKQLYVPYGASIEQGLTTDNILINGQLIIGNEIHLPATATEGDIQAAMNNISTANVGTLAAGAVYLSAGATYKIVNGLILQAANCSLFGNGAVLDCSSLGTSGVGLTITNTLNTLSGSFVTFGCRVRDLKLFGDSTQGGANYNSTTGILIQGVPNIAGLTLSGSINASATALTLSSAANVPTLAVSVLIDSEYILLAPGSGTTRTIQTRGFLGTTPASHNNGAAITTTHDCEPLTENIGLRYFNKAVSFGDSAFASVLDMFDVSNNFYGIYGAALTNTFQAENIKITNSDIYNNNTGLYAEHQIFRFFGTSFDYNKRSLSLNLASSVEAYGCHFEWNYGQGGGDTNPPFFLTGANCTLLVKGGKIFYEGSQAAAYVAPFYSDNNSQYITLDDVEFHGLGNPASVTSDDCLFTSATSNHNSATIGKIRVINPKGFLMTDLPSCLAYETGPNWLDSGLNWVIKAMDSRTVVTGGGALTDAGASSGTVTAKVASSMVKITPGTYYFTMPVNSRDARRYWSLFANGADATGSVKFSEVLKTVHPKWDGSTGLTFQQDSLTQAFGPYTFPTIATNQWTRVSWKNVYSDPFSTYHAQPDYVTLKIDASSMVGSFYICCFAWAEM